MRGKKGAQAAIRRDREELEQRATKAEHAANRLESELSALKERTDREIHNLRTALAEAKRQRDAATSPALDEAAQQLVTLREEAARGADDLDALKKGYRKLETILVRMLEQAGYTTSEASVAVTLFATEAVRRLMTGPVKWTKEDKLSKKYGMEAFDAVRRAQSSDIAVTRAMEIVDQLETLATGAQNEARS